MLSPLAKDNTTKTATPTQCVFPCAPPPPPPPPRLVKISLSKLEAFFFTGLPSRRMISLHGMRYLGSPGNRERQSLLVSINTRSSVSCEKRCSAYRGGSQGGHHAFYHPSLTCKGRVHVVVPKKNP